MEDFVETHLCKLCATVRSRVLRLCVHIKDTIGRRLPLELQCGYQGQLGDVSQSVRKNYVMEMLAHSHHESIFSSTALVYRRSHMCRFECNVRMCAEKLLP